MELFAKRIRERARELGLSDAEVARRAGLSERRYGYYATGEREPNLPTLVQICGVLATTPNELLLEAEKPHPLSDRERRVARITAVIDRIEEPELELAACQLECLTKYRTRQKRKR